MIEFLRQKKFWILAGASILLIAFSPISRARVEAKTVTIPIHAGNFAFSPGVIKVNQGDQVVIELTSLDVVHGFYLDSYGHSITSDPGQTAVVSFTADQAGTFRFRCSVTCGALHPFMVGKLIVGNNDLVWRGTALALLLGVFGWWRTRND